MFSSKIACLFLVFFFDLLRSAYNANYSDLEALGVVCPKRDKCEGYRNNLTYLQRSCECDSECHTYSDCCIDAPASSADHNRPKSKNTVCLNYGEHFHEGIYVISKCSKNWNGLQQVKQKCEGAKDLSDPVSAAPAVSLNPLATYKNLYCAECNDAPMESLKLFAFKVACEGVDDIPADQIMDNLSYNEKKKKWGIDRSDTGEFVACQMFFDVPSYLNTTVRFCRANIISKCSRTWTRVKVKQLCDEYMAVVFDEQMRAYRNPHCAICNQKTVSDLTCLTDLFGRRRPFSFSTLIDVNREEDKKSSCPANHIYDPYFKKCKPLSCAFPGYVVRDGKCVPGN